MANKEKITSNNKEKKLSLKLFKTKITRNNTVEQHLAKGCPVGLAFWEAELGWTRL